MTKIESRREHAVTAITQGGEPADRHIETIPADGFAHTQEVRRGR